MRTTTVIPKERKVPLALPDWCHAFVPLEDPFGGEEPRALTRCDENLICQRCEKCIEHCHCGPNQKPMENPKRKQKGPDDSQMILCDKPDLHY